MEIQDKVQSREAAGMLLARRIVHLHLDNAVVAGIPHGGVSVASAVAQQLGLPLEIVLCRKIKHPANQSVNLGSVSARNVYLDDCPPSLPNDYLNFQIHRLQKEIAFENEFYYGKTADVNFEFRTVILVDDILVSPDSLLAGIREIRRQKPMRIIVAVPLVEAEAARIIQSECDELIFLKMQQVVKSPLDFYRDFPVVRDWDVRDLLRRAKGELIVVKLNPWFRETGSRNTMNVHWPTYSTAESSK